MNGIPDSQKSESAPSANPLIGTERRCSRCGVLKKENDFYKCCRTICKQCRYMSARTPERKMKHSESMRKWYVLNSVKINEERKRRYRDNPEVREKMRIRRKETRGQHREYEARYRAKNRDNVMRRLNSNMATVMGRSLCGEKRGRKWELLAGYTCEQLKAHLEKQFTPDMTWDNYGSHWWIDHKTPKAAFNFETPSDIDFKHCWALKNLQPLEKSANIKKADRVDKPFQPSLAIAIL